MRTPMELIGAEAMMRLAAEGYEVVAVLKKAESRFDDFWSEYPRKTAKPAALKAYNAAIKRRVSHDTIMAGLQRFVASKPNPQYTPHASTWLNQDRWNDAPVTVPAPDTFNAIDRRRAALAERISNDHGIGRQGNRDPRPDRGLPAPADALLFDF